MTDPSNPDLVEQLASRYFETSKYVNNGWNTLMLEELSAYFREAISVTRRETLEQAAKLSVPQDEILGTAEYREGYREGQAYIAAEIRRIGENK